MVYMSSESHIVIMNFVFFSVMMVTHWLYYLMVLGKKSQKLKQSDVEKALKLKQEYYESKE